jgi:hypothetical protein
MIKVAFQMGGKVNNSTHDTKIQGWSFGKKIKSYISYHSLN